MAIAALPVAEMVPPPLPPLPPGQWPVQGEWTYEDYLRLPDEPEHRYEVIFGALYMSNTPDLLHQVVVTNIPQVLGPFVKAGRRGRLLVAPFEVRLPGIAQPVQPDALFVRAERREIVTAQSVDGAPDLVVEVLSPSTARVDRAVKFSAYEQAGVQEYWMVHPKARFVEVFVLEGGGYVLLGEYAPGERLVSRVLDGLDVDAGALFEQG